MALLQVDALGGGFTGRVGRDRIELARELRGELGKLVLAPADLLQPLDQVGALAIGLFEQPAEGQDQPMRTISRCRPSKNSYPGESLLRRDLPWCELSNERGGLGIVPPIPLFIDWSVPISCRR